ncbi:MAG: acyl-CoA thioesterase [Thermodesulfobacteriota bacterium]
MPTIKETKNQMIQFVFPEYANTHGNLHGGRLMDWIMLIGSITSSRVAKGTTVLGSTDSIDFINPVNIGEIVVLDSWVEYIGDTSLEVIVRVYSENVETGKRKFITLSYLGFVAIDKKANPREVPSELAASNDLEKEIIKKAKYRKERRVPEIEKRREKVFNLVDETENTRFNLKTTRLVLPEDAFYGNFMSVGKLLKYVDESAAILAKRFTKGILVTGSLDNLFLYSPIRVGEVIEFKAGITYVGKTSLETAIKVESQDLETGEYFHTCTAFLTYVNLNKEGKTSTVPEFYPETPYEIREWKEAEKRREIRNKRLKETKEMSDIWLSEI